MAGLDGNDRINAFLLHGSAVRLREKGILLIGRSGRGKSDLALQMIDRGALLIADDQVLISRNGDRLMADAPPQLSGLIEVRGVGIVRLPHAGGVLDLVVDLDIDDEETRLPDAMMATWHGLNLPKIRINAKSPAAIAKINVALHAERVA